MIKATVNINVPYKIVSTRTGDEVYSNVKPHLLAGMIQWWRMGIISVSSIFFTEEHVLICSPATKALSMAGTSKIFLAYSDNNEND